MGIPQGDSPGSDVELSWAWTIVGVVPDVHIGGRALGESLQFVLYDVQAGDLGVCTAIVATL
jgi:hypothetical protein